MIAFIDAIRKYDRQTYNSGESDTLTVEYRTANAKTPLNVYKRCAEDAQASVCNLITALNRANLEWNDGSEWATSVTAAAKKISDALEEFICNAPWEPMFLATDGELITTIPMGEENKMNSNRVRLAAFIRARKEFKCIVGQWNGSVPEPSIPLPNNA